MQLSDIFSQLSFGELSQLSIGGANAGVIDASNYPNAVAHVNMGLNALYSRFPLKEGRLTFNLQPGRTLYPLDTREDTDFTGNDDFLDDVIKVEKVFTAEGVEMSVNDGADFYSCHTPSATVLRVPYDLVNAGTDLPSELVTSALKVAYRASHPLIVVNGAGFNPAYVTVELPYSYLQPLLLFIASRIHNPIGMTNEFNAGNNYAAKYEKACQQLEQLGLRIDQGSQNTRLQRNGWV